MLCLNWEKKKKKKKILNIFIDFIDYYDQILTVFFFKNGVCHLSGDGRGERWVPHPFFLVSSELLPRKPI